MIILQACNHAHMCVRASSDGIMVDGSPPTPVCVHTFTYIQCIFNDWFFSFTLSFYCRAMCKMAMLVVICPTLPATQCSHCIGLDFTTPIHQLWVMICIPDICWYSGAIISIPTFLFSLKAFYEWCAGQSLSNCDLIGWTQVYLDTQVHTVIRTTDGLCFCVNLNAVVIWLIWYSNHH